MIEFLNYQPFYYLIPLRMMHIICILILWYLFGEIKKDIEKMK